MTFDYFLLNTMLLFESSFVKRTLENSKDYQTNLINIFEPKILNLVPPAELA